MDGDDDLPPMPILIPMSPDIVPVAVVVPRVVSGQRVTDQAKINYVTSDSKGSCERAVFHWGIQEDTLPLPIIPPEHTNNPPAQDSSESILDLTKSISSGIFIRGQEVNKPADWHLSLVNKSKTTCSELQLVLQCERIYIQPTLPILAKVAYEIVDEDNLALWSSGDVYECGLKTFMAGYRHVMEFGHMKDWQQDKTQFMQGGILRIRLRLNIYKDLTQEADRSSNQTGSSNQPPACKRMRQDCGVLSGFTELLGSLEQLWRTRDESGDITIVCVQKEIKAHKFILTGRSEVFKGMFSSEMQTEEKTSSVIKVDDITPDIMIAMMEFLYLRHMTRFDWDNVDHICALVYAADKYWITDLMTKCYQHLLNLMNLKNFAKIAKVTFMYNTENQFKDAVQHFYLSNQARLNTVESFRKFANDDFEEFYKLFFYDS